jgi:hypothetical protein
MRLPISFLSFVPVFTYGSLLLAQAAPTQPPAAYPPRPVQPAQQPAAQPYPAQPPAAQPQQPAPAAYPQQQPAAQPYAAQQPAAQPYPAQQPAAQPYAAQQPAAQPYPAQQPPAAQPQPASAAACFPECRAGYFCNMGTCVQRCNPPCGANQICTDTGACVTATETTAPGVTPNDDLGPKNFAIGAGPGIAFAGSIDYEGIGEIDTDSSWLFDFYADAILIPALSMGGYVTLSSLPPDEGDSDAASFLSVGVSLKGRIRLSRAVRIRPALLFGYNNIDHEDWDDASSGMNVGFQADVAIALNDSFALVPRFGFFSQPVGGNDAAEITFAPHPSLAVAVEWGQ